MPLQIHNPKTRTKHPFIPIRPNKASLYVCGLTVQDRPHLGHMFAFVACDMIRRYLTHLGYEVTHVQNFTDIDDKIITRARQEGIDTTTLTARNIAAYHTAAAALQIHPAHHYPKVTDHIPDIIAFTKKLINNNHAYESSGDVYFRVRSYENYGNLSGRNLDDMRSAVRIEVGARKQDPLDFTLWKRSQDDEPGWDSPWGRGRPGWHIECSAMATRYLGDHFDFHGGGRDLLFPHHENELAQSCCATGQPYVNHWLHNGLLYLGKSKMSKSDGNFLAMDTLLERHPPEVLRFFLLNAHFRSQLDFSEDRLHEARSSYDRLKRGTQAVLTALDSPRDETNTPIPAGLTSVPGGILADATITRRRRFFAAMDDDFNSGAAMGELFGLVKDVHQYLTATGGRGLDPTPLQAAKTLLTEADTILGIFPQGLTGLANESKKIPESVAALAQQRQKARHQRDWTEADTLRDRIRAEGWDVEDTPQGARLVPLRPDS